MTEKEIAFIDMDNVLVDFASGLARVKPEILEQYKDDGKGKPHYDDIPGIFSLMDPMPGAIEAVRKLGEKYDLYILSTAPWNNPSAWSDKLLWVQKYLGREMYKRLILSHHKDLCIQPGAFLIDDRTGHGADRFKDHFLHFGKDGEYRDWDAVVSFLMER